jgi:hypothetical protein
MLCAMHRVYFDTNEASFEDGTCRYELRLSASVRDLASIADKHDGMRVIVYMTGELEMEAALEFDAQEGCWMARPIEGTTKIYPEALGLPQD